MILSFPMWQGVGYPTSIPEGTKRLTALVDDPARVIAIPVGPLHELQIEDGIYAKTEILDLYHKANAAIRAKNPKKLITLGGDCGMDIASIAHLNNLYKGDLQVFWFDAHADLNTPESSFSAHFHGMPLRMLLGEGPKEFVDPIPLKLKPEQVAFFGLRSIDPPEQEYIDAHKIRLLDPATHGHSDKKFANAHIHVDCDIMDPSVFNEFSCPVPGGVTLETLISAVSKVFDHYNVVGCTLTEYAPAEGGNGLEKLKKLLLDGYRMNSNYWTG